jgi:PAS domain S-box-containing protein
VSILFGVCRKEWLRVMNQRAIGAELRKFGTPIVGDVVWGTHLCQFYQTKQDLIDILVPYFAEGLRNNEFCMWITSPPLDVEEAREALGRVVPNLDEYVRNGQIEILPYAEWYLVGGEFNADRVLEGWVRKEKEALARRLEGLRLTGNTFWIERAGWNSFVDYEARVNDVIGSHKIIALCTYSLEKCSGDDVIDVIRNHVGTLIRKGETWNLVEDVAKRKEVEHELGKSEKKYRSLFTSIVSGAAYYKVLFNNGGKPIDYVFLEINDAFEKLTGLKRGETVGKKVTEVFHEGGKAVEDLIGIYGKVAATGEAAQLDYYFDPLKKWYQITVFCPEKGHFVATFQDITERKRMEEALRQSEETLDAFFEASPAILNIEDEEFRYLKTDRTTPTYFGLDRQSIVGKSVKDLAPDFSGNYETMLRRVIETGQPQLNMEVKSIVPSRSGETATWRASYFPVPLAEGKRGIGIIGIDITDMKKAEESLQESERRYRALVDSAPDAILVHRDGKVLYANPVALELYGADSIEQLASHNILNLVHADDVKESADRLRRIMEGQRLPLREARIFRLDGREIPIEVVSSPIEYKGGRAVQAIMRDITARKKTQEEVARLASFPKLNPNPVIEIGFDGTIHYSNPAADLTLSEFSNSGLDNPFFADWERIVKALQNDKNDSFAREVRVGDKWFYQLFSLVPETNRVRIYAVNIDRLKQAENAVRETRDYLDNLLNYANAPIIVWDPDFRITKFNRAFEHLTGLLESAVLGKHLKMLFPENKKEEAMAHIQSTLAGEFWETVEIPILHVDGTVSTLLWNSANIYPPDNKTIIATIAQGQDITKRKKLEEQLKDAERFSAIGQTAAMVGHDLRNPLQAIIGFISLAEEQLKGMDLSSAEKREYKKKLEAISDQTHYMNKIITDLQDYARPVKPSPARTDVGHLIKETLSTLRVPENVIVSIDIPKHFPKVRIDPAIVRRVLTNLIANALQAMPDGGKLSLKASRKKNPQTLVISVEDTGVGIAKANRPKIFTPLFTTKSKGQGFGLPVCKRLLDAQGGTITFKSRVGKGCKFTITIPLLEKAEKLIFHSTQSE